jgi:hypothetical protein
LEAIVPGFVYVCDEAMRHGEDSDMRPEKRPDIATQIMSAMVRMPPEHHKSATKPKTAKG